jgi:hypothetical protein
MPMTDDRLKIGSDRMNALLARIEEHARDHMTGLSTEADLRALESSLGCALPAPYRTLLARTGGGIYYLRHEIFGARRVMIHDIELVPDVFSFRHWLGDAVPAGWLPVHRCESQIHILKFDGGDDAPVRLLDGSGPGYKDFATFFESVVMG